MTQGSALPRPPLREERLANRLFLGLAPRLPRTAQSETPSWLAPFEHVAVERPEGGALSATWYPAPETARGAVLLLHPWAVWGKAYFHRRNRLRALRAAGYHALTLDFSGFGASAPPAGFLDRDVEAALAGGRHRIVPRAGHLGSIKLATDEVLALAIETFRQAEAASVASHPPERPAAADPEDVVSGFGEGSRNKGQVAAAEEV